MHLSPFQHSKFPPVVWLSIRFVKLIISAWLFCHKKAKKLLSPTPVVGGKTHNLVKIKNRFTQPESKGKFMNYNYKLQKELNSEYQLLDKARSRHQHFEKLIDSIQERIIELETLHEKLKLDDPDFAVHAEAERVLYRHNASLGYNQNLAIKKAG